MGWLEVADCALSVGSEAFAHRLLHAGFLLGILLNPEYGGILFFQNDGCPSTHYTALLSLNIKLLNAVSDYFCQCMAYNCIMKVELYILFSIC
jgi:hypothetical protein